MSLPASNPVPNDPSPSPLVSVIVRSMDRPSLPLALDSVALQDHPNVELLVVDARGSGHGLLPASAGPHPLRLLHQGRPLPRSQAANAGLDAALGQLAIFLDDDDVFLPGHLSRLVAALQSQPGAVAAYADVAYGRQQADGWQTQHLFAADFDPLRLRFENFLPLHAVMVDLQAVGVRQCRFDESLDLFEDWDWMLQLSRRGVFVHVPGVSAHYVAAAQGSSGVFDDSTASSAARAQLLHKWLAMDTPAQRLELLQALQQHYRAAHQAADQLALAQRTEHNLRGIIDNRSQQVASLQQVLAAREQELANFTLEQQALRQVLAAREREVADSLQHAQALQQILTARDEEIAHLRHSSQGTAGAPPKPTP